MRRDGGTQPDSPLDQGGPWLATARLTASRPTPDDVDSVWRIHSDPDTYRHHPLGRMQHPDGAAGLLGLWIDHWQERGFGYAAIRPRDSWDVIGFAGLRRQRLLGGVLNLYYRFSPTAWGKGYATEIGAALIDWAATNHSTTPVIARVALNNAPSMRVAERIGLVPTTLTDPGEPVPHVIYASEQWQGEALSTGPQDAQGSAH